MSTTNWPIEFTRNPLNIQQKILNRFEEYSGGDFIADPNNVVSFTIEMFSELTAGAANEIDNSVMSAMYPARAQSTSDLYKHMSDWDYVNIFSSPAKATIQLSLDKTYLIANAVDVYDDNGTLLAYKKVVIPKTTLITIGSYTFGLYYPIEIRINTVSETFSVVYDASESNPLCPIQNNILEHSFRQYENLKLLYIQIPVYQFSIDRHSEELISGTGYKKTFTYKDLFYAIRCTASVLVKGDGSSNDDYEVQELALALSNQSYDQTTPTVVFTVLPESKTCEVYIPYVYFSQGLIKGTLSIEIYTTAGKLNYTIPTNTTEICSLSFFTDYITEEEAKYAEPLRSIPAIAAVPLNTVVSGGTNGMTYEDLRYKVITDTFSDQPLQTPDDVDAYFKNRKYVTTKFRDGITDRIFISHKELVDDKDAIVGAASIKTQFNLATINEVSTIHQNTSDANVYTILPSTIYKFDKTSGSCIPLTSNEILALNASSLSDKVAAYNSGEYTISPFHLQVSVDPTYPTTITYDLMHTEITSREFIGENTSTASQLTVYATRFNHLSDGVGGYELNILVSRTDDLADYQAEYRDEDNEDNVTNFKVIVVAKTIYGTSVYATATFSERSNNIDIFRLPIGTDYEFYQVDNEHAIGITDTFSSLESGDTSHPLALVSEFRILLCAKSSIITSSGTVSNKVDSENATNLPSGNTGYVVLSEQKLNVKFGEVVNELDQRMSLSYSQAEYKTYDTTKFLTINQPIYQKDENGVFTYTTSYVLTSDIVFRSNVAYYTFENGVYPLAIVNTGDSIPANTYYVKKINLTEEYAVGTLTMMTEKTTEIVILTASVASRYYGCKFTPNGSSTSVTLSSSNAESFYGVQGTVEVQRSPRFIISGAYSETSSGAAVVGTYNILDPRSTKALSSSGDQWVMNKWDTVAAEYDTYKVRVVDALMVALKMASVVETHEVLMSMTAIDGCFVFVKNDGTTVDGITTYTEPLYGTLVADATNTAVGTARLFYRYDGVWRCLVGGRLPATGSNFKSDMVAAIKALNAGYLVTEDTIILDKPYYTYNAGVYSRYYGVLGATITSAMGLYEKRPSFMGYAYVIEKSIDAANAATTLVDAEYGLGELMYVSFLTTNNGFVSVANVATVKVNVDGSYESTDLTWTDTINKWPWDSLTWFRTKQISLSYTLSGNTVATTITSNRLIADDLFTAAYDPQGTTKYCEYVTGQLVLDEDGKPQEDSDNVRDIVYLINMLQLDAKLTIASTSEYSSYPENVRAQMRTYFDELGDAKAKLYANSRLFFEPLKSFGYGTFTVGDSEVELPLDITMTFKLYVSKSASEDLTLVDSLTESIISIIDTYIDSNVVNCADIAKKITEDLSDSVKYVDVLGINGDVTLQTMTCVDTNVRPHLKHILKLLDDGTTVDVTRGLSIELVVIE